MSRPSLLLIEDKRNYQIQMELYAEQFGYLINYAKTPYEAVIQYAGRPPFNVIVVDLQLGDEDVNYQGGWKFLRQTTQDQNTYIVIFTGHEDPQTLMVPWAAVEGRTFTLLQKGRDAQRLEAILREQAALHNMRTKGS